MIENFTVHQYAYHRNGISGIGFYAVSFSYTEYGKKRTALATVNGMDVQCVRDRMPHDPDTRVLMYNDRAKTYDITETMRGDHFHDKLCRWLIATEDANTVKLSKPA